MTEAVPLTAREVAEGVLVDGGHRAKLIRYACSQLGLPREDADDLLQDTALELLRQRSRVHSPEGYVFTAFRARCLRHLRSLQIHRKVFPEASPPGEDSRPPSAPSLEFDRVLALREALGSVSSTCRRLLAAYYVEGRSLRETATTVALAPASLGKTMSRCLRRLKESL